MSYGEVEHDGDEFEDHDDFYPEYGMGSGYRHSLSLGTGDVTRLYDIDSNGYLDYFEMSWNQGGIEMEEHGSITYDPDHVTNHMVTLTGQGIGGATLYSEQAQLIYTGSQLTGMDTALGSNVMQRGLSLIDFDDLDDPVSVASGREYEDMEYDTEVGGRDHDYLASMRFSTVPGRTDSMHLYDTDFDGSPDYYETAWDDDHGIERREHGTVVINAANGTAPRTATLTAQGLGGATLHSETAELSFDAQGQLTGLMSSAAVGEGLDDRRMGMIDFDDLDDPVSVAAGYEYEDMEYDTTISTSGYLSSLRIVGGDDTRLFDDDGDDDPDRFESSWTSGGQHHVERGTVSLGAGNTVTLTGRDDAGNERFTEMAEMALDTQGQLVGLTMSATGGTRATARVKTWDDDALEGVHFDDNHVSDATGGADFHRLTAASSFAVAPVASSALTTGASSAVDLMDAIAILKMMVGLTRPTNGYQVAAADMDSSGGVDLLDAISVLKHVVGLTAPTPSWAFASASATSVADVNTLKVNHRFDTAISQDVSTDTTVDIVGILRGDVDGSWMG